MSNYLLLNQPQVFNGLGTLTYTVPTAGTYNVSLSATFPASLPIGGRLNGTPGTTPTPTPGGAGSGIGGGAGTGGGGEGFTGGDLGLGHGNPGQGFGSTNGYQQPPSAPSNIAAQSPVYSGYSAVVNKNGSPIYTSTAPVSTGFQSALQFKYGFQAAVNDVITVVITGNATSDKALEGVISTISVNQGQ